MALDPRRLAIFLAVYREGSLGRASKALNLTQPAVSKTVRRLEEQLRVRLFDRSPRGMLPTEYARVLATHAELVSAELNRAAEEIEALRGVSKGRILVGATPSIIGTVLPTALGAVLRQRPGLTVHVLEGLEGGLLQALMRGEIDLAVIGGMRRLRDYPVTSEVLFADEVNVVCRPGHPLMALAAPGPGDLLSYPWVLPERENVMWRRLSEYFHEREMDPPSTTVQTGSASFMKAFVAASDFLTYLPRALIREEEACGRLAVPHGNPGAWKRQVTLVRRREGALPLAATALVKELRSLARTLAA